MAEQKEAAIHFSDGTKIICGTKTGLTASGEQVVTCKRCIKLLEARQAKVIKPTKVIEPPTISEDPKAIHFSDGEKAICGAKLGTAVTDEQKVTCKGCQDILAKKAQGEGDPLIWVRVKAQDLNDGVDFKFSFGRKKENPSQMKTYHLLNNEVVRLPKSVIEHLKHKAYPYKRYIPGQDSGHAMQVAGKYRRFTVTELTEAEAKESEHAKIA